MGSGGNRGSFQSRGGRGGRGSMYPRRNFNFGGQRGNFRRNNMGFGRGGPMMQRRYDGPNQRNFRPRGFGRQNSRGGYFNRAPQFYRPGPFSMRRGGGVVKRGMGIGFNRSIPTKLYISNLDFGVSNQDIKDLFSEFGRIRRFGVNYAQEGQSLGTAEVLFENRNSAMRAAEKYNNVTLDGRAMKLAVEGPSSTGRGVPMVQNRRPPMRPVNNQNRSVGQGVTKKLVQRSKMNLMNRGRGANRGRGMARGTVRGWGGVRRGFRGGMRGRGRGAAGGRGGKKPAPTQEELDADLAAFTAKTE